MNEPSSRTTLPHPPWWVTAIRGVAALAFGVLALVWPGITLIVLVALFAAYALLSGIAALAGFMRSRGTDGRWPTLLLGIVGLVAGVLAIVYPGSTLFALVLLLGANALVSGVLDIVRAVRLRREIRGEWLLALTGVVSIVFGVLVLAVPLTGVLALVWMVSFFATLTGVLLLALAFRERRWERQQPHTPRPA